ncbi:MAG: glutaminase A [Actinomycetes bacterium]
MSPERGFVSTGRLPDASVVQRAIEAVHELYRGNEEGRNAQVYPALARADPTRFGVCFVSVTGDAYGAGDADVEFTIMSVAKPFVFALVCQAGGPEAAAEHIGVDATGRAFNSLTAVESSPDGRTNPMVNAGAIATTSRVPGATPEDKWAAVLEGLSGFAGRTLAVDEEVYASASATNDVNRAASWLLHDRGLLASDPDVALDLYTRLCSLSVTARDLAVMGATLADGGVNPVTGRRVLDQPLCHHVLAVMLTAGLYEISGEWLYRVGLPGKSGIGGGIVTVSPGKGGLGTYAPPLDAAGNSVRGQLVARHLSHQLGLDLLTSSPSR